MKRSQKWLVGLGACASLGLAAAVYAAPETTGKDDNQAETHAHRGMQQGMQHGGMGMQGHSAQHELMASATPEQRHQTAQGRHGEKHGTAQGEQHRHEQSEGKGPRGNERRGAQAEEHKH